MRMSPSFAPLACGVASAVFLSGLVLIAPDLVLAQEKGTGGAATCTCPAPETDQLRRTPRPKFAEVRPALDNGDEIATLEAVQLALSEVGDGSSYVWHRRNGRLSGVVRPTTSFKDGSGKICRHIVIALSTDGYSRSTEGIACRLASGVWQLEG